MHASVNGVRLFFDVEGAKVAAEDQASCDAWLRLAMPVYTRIPRDPDMARRTISPPEVALHWFAWPDGESDRFNMLRDVGRTRSPTLVRGGEDNPMHPIESQADIAAALPVILVQFERFADCGHGVVPDAPERAMALLREFVLRRQVNFLPRVVNERRHPLGSNT